MHLKHNIKAVFREKKNKVQFPFPKLIKIDLNNNLCWGFRQCYTQQLLWTSENRIVIHRSQHSPLMLLGKQNDTARKPYVLQRSVKLANTVFLVPSRITCGGLMTVLRLSPASSGLFSRRMLNTLPRSCANRQNMNTGGQNKQDLQMTRF